MRLLAALPVALATGWPGGIALADTPPAVSHALGQTPVPATPKRVVTLFQGATDITLALGVTPVATVESWVEKPIYQYLRKALDKVSVIGLETQPSLEDIARLKPDLIIASKFRNERIYDLLSYIAPTVAAKDIFSFRENTRLIGAALGRQEMAAALLARFDRRIAKTRMRLRDRFKTAWPASAAILDFRSDHVRIYLADSFAGSILSELGFRPPPKLARTGWSLMKLTNKESMPAIDADVFFVMLRADNAAARQNYEDWSGHLLWKQLAAVKNDQVYKVDPVSWSLAGGMLSANLMLDQLERECLLQPEEN